MTRSMRRWVLAALVFASTQATAQQASPTVQEALRDAVRAAQEAREVVAALDRVIATLQRMETGHRTRHAWGQGQANTNAIGACRIKGNVSKDGTRIYHVPGGGYYDRTRIDASRGERWFCSEREARHAGWRRSRR